DIDWIAYARTDRYYVKRYREETNLRCNLMLDASASMGFASAAAAHEGGEPLSKLAYACRLAACLAYLAVRQRDAVGLTICQDSAAQDLPARGTQAQLAEIFRRLEKVQARGKSDLAAALHAAAERLRRRGMVMIISDLLEDEAEIFHALRHLRHRRHELIVFHLLDPAEEYLPYEGVSDFIDPESGARLRADPIALRSDYQEAIAAFRSRCRRECAADRISYVEACTSEPFPRLLQRYLARRR
ncbi:MAG: DUF58 domain-containing protein, partial [Planctomycetota bacterium]|nr:DUF58 domain-containing protein [Planctomycetota bacterium]